MGLQTQDIESTILVKYGGSILRCTVGHVASANITNANFVTEFPGFNFYQEWSNSVYYAIGDIVRHGGYLYIANANNYVSDSLQQMTATNWRYIKSKAVNFAGAGSAL
jgi:hypothetical protein